MPYPFTGLPTEVQKQLYPLLQHVKKEIQVADMLRKDEESPQPQGVAELSITSENVVLDRELIECSDEEDGFTNQKYHFCDPLSHQRCISVPNINSRIRVEAVSGIDNSNNFNFWGEFSVIPFLETHDCRNIEHITLHTTLEYPHIDHQAQEWMRIMRFLEDHLDLESLVFKGINWDIHFLDLKEMKNDPMRWVAALAFMFGVTSLTLEMATPYEMVEVLDDPLCLEGSAFRQVQASEIELRFRRL